ncbi:hypothetical protein [Raineyella fluvialis]|uniref:Uncharacterized protein n=1 Tax=Raineyella fluvialis TaxID=2662261 RepID=A0A5Q2FA56_9ACTN|nr:hypothetical protein [Raineyella fluvialis]QGF23792.1 hypothetical protein Rai3103_09020 [Raineyella fluvialis]
MSDQHQPQDQQRPEEPRDAERDERRTQEEIDELEANGAKDLKGTADVTESEGKVNRGEGPVL